MKPEMMDEYKNISMETYQTIDELLICYNHQCGFIEYNYKHTLRVKKIDSLYGMAIYHNITVHALDLPLVEKALRRMI